LPISLDTDKIVMPDKIPIIDEPVKRPVILKIMEQISQSGDDDEDDEED